MNMRSSWWLLIGITLSSGQAAETEAISQPALRAELLELRRIDQEVRTSDRIAASEMGEVDSRNTARLKAIIAEYGWPTKSMVGNDGASAAWLLAQHADRDPEFQQSVLVMIEKLLSRGEAKSSDYAYLYDRTHSPQRYGTQGTCVAPGKWEPREIENPETVDDRRASMSIIPAKLADYIERVSTLCK
jgi:hypothetical protein